jgi:hypothetical protein
MLPPHHRGNTMNRAPEAVMEHVSAYVKVEVGGKPEG